MGDVPPCSSRKMIKALKKVGLIIDSRGGKGSHTKVVDPKSGRSTTVPSGTLSYVREDIVKWAAKLGYSKKKIIDSL